MGGGGGFPGVYSGPFLSVLGLIAACVYLCGFCFVFGIGRNRHSARGVFLSPLLVIMGMTLFCLSGFANHCHVLCSCGSFFFYLFGLRYLVVSKRGFPYYSLTYQWAYFGRLTRRGFSRFFPGGPFLVFGAFSFFWAGGSGVSNFLVRC